jgi:hypothetical protein
MKRNIGILALALSLLTIPVFAQTENDFTVELTADGEGVVITGYTGRTAQVRIPATIQGMPIREIGSRDMNSAGAFAESPATSVVIPVGVTSINRGAFNGLRNLTSVTIPEGVTVIGERAFYGTGIRTINLPESLTTLGTGAFGSTKLTSITIPAGVREIPEECFEDCANLQTLVLNEGLTSISTIAFAFCKALTTLALPASIKSIGVAAFQWCTALTAVTIPDSAQLSIDSSAFDGCAKLNLASQALIRRKSVN